MPIPDDRTFTLRDVCNETQSWSRSTAFQYANDSYFDPRYKGNKDRLSNFRNYGYTGGLVYRNTLSLNHGITDIHGSGENTTAGFHFFTTSIEGFVSAFFIDNSGIISKYPNTYSIDGAANNIYCHSLSKIFVTTYNDLEDRSLVYWLSFNTSTGNFSIIATAVYDFSYGATESKLWGVTANDDATLLFCNGFWGDGYQTIDIITVGASYLTKVSTFDAGGDVKGMRWVNGYLVAGVTIGTTDYLRTYSYSGGTLSLVSSYTSTYGAIGKIETDGNGLIFCAHEAGTYITSWRIGDNGSISFRDSDPNGYGASGIAYSPVAGTPISTDGNNVYSFRMNALDDYILEDTEIRDGSQDVYAGFLNRFVMVYSITFPGAVRYDLYSYEII